MTHATSSALPNLPADAEALRALVLATRAERDAVVAERDRLLAERDALAARNERLHRLLLKLRRLQFGRKSERLPEQQRQLGLEDIEAAIARNDAEAERQDLALHRDRAAKRRASRGALPAHLPRVELDLAPPANHRDGLGRFLDDGRVEIDSNSVERSMRPVALGRKNALFAGSDEGGENWVAIASLIETCKLNAVDPQRYFAELLTRLINGWPQARIDELMPWRRAETLSA